MNRKKRILTVVFVLFGVLIFPTWRLYREVQQARLDQALITAIKAGDNPKTLELLAQGANGEARDTGKPPTFQEALLHVWDHFRHPGAVPSRQSEKSSALLLLYERAIRKATHSDSNMLVFFGRAIGDPDYGSGPDLTVVRALLDHGAQVNDRTKDGISALEEAAFFSNRDTVRLLLSRGADIEAKDTNQQTSLMFADAGVTRVLMEHGANMEAKDEDNMTPLMHAVINNQPEVVRILLEHGAKVSPKDRYGLTALDWERSKQFSHAHKIAALLRKYGAK